MFPKLVPLGCDAGLAEGSVATAVG